MSFDIAFNDLIGLEGNYSDDARDPGNWTGGSVNSGQLKGTKYGISAASYPILDIVNLSQNAAKAIYKRDFWDALKCDAFPDPVAQCLFKQAVNMGVNGATVALQRSLKSTPDGVIGQLTIGRATSIPIITVLDQFLTECAIDYVAMANFKVDGRGWLSRVIKTALQANLS